MDSTPQWVTKPDAIMRLAIKKTTLRLIRNDGKLKPGGHWVSNWWSRYCGRRALISLDCLIQRDEKTCGRRCHIAFPMIATPRTWKRLQLITVLMLSGMYWLQTTRGNTITEALSKAQPIHWCGAHLIVVVFMQRGFEWAKEVPWSAMPQLRDTKPRTNHST